MSKRKLDELKDPSTSSQIASTIFESTPINDRSSTFIAIFSPSTTPPRTLQRHKPFEGASHKILAWRKPSAQRSLTGSFSAGTTTAALASSNTAANQSSQGASGIQKAVIHETGSDDDGEKYAGKKLEKLLTDMGIEGTVVVARWYGGVLLGPVRFKWIEDSAREAILKWKATLMLEGEGDGKGAETKKVKTDEARDISEAREKEALVRVLEERDASVNVLRGLLAEKTIELEGKGSKTGSEGDAHTDKQAESAKGSRSAVPDYASMPTQRLKQLEKARDATLTWILKQIDVVEEKLEAYGKTNKS